MRIPLNLFRARVAGFTLVEMYISLALFVILVAATVAMQFFASRVYTLAATKLTSTASARKVMNDMRDQIRESVGLAVGTYNTSANTFSIIPSGSQQIGNALAIYPNITANANNAYYFAIIYFMNQQATNVCSVIYSNSQVLTATLANNVVVYITNYYVFDAEDSHTVIQTNYEKDRVIQVKFQFAEWEYPLATTTSSNGMYDYYQLHTRVAMRMPVY